MNNVVFNLADRWRRVTDKLTTFRKHMTISIKEVI